MKSAYELAFLLGLSNWKIPHTPAEVLDTAASLKAGVALDLGCGEGEHSIALAKQGWRVVGIDFIKRAIRKARSSALTEDLDNRVSFLTGDVTRLEEMDLPMADLVVDIGCFHLLSPLDQEKYINGLKKITKPGAVFLLNAFLPRKQGKRTVGLSLQQVQELFFGVFILQNCRNHSYWRFPANWYWLVRKKGDKS